jgi:hypothetical protein
MSLFHQSYIHGELPSALGMACVQCYTCDAFVLTGNNSTRTHTHTHTYVCVDYLKNTNNKILYERGYLGNWKLNIRIFLMRFCICNCSDI